MEITEKDALEAEIFCNNLLETYHYYWFAALYAKSVSLPLLERIAELEKELAWSKQFHKNQSATIQAYQNEANDNDYNECAKLQQAKSEQPTPLKLREAIKAADEYRFSQERRNLEIVGDRGELLNHLQTIVEASQGLPVEEVYIMPLPITRQLNNIRAEIHHGNPSLSELIKDCEALLKLEPLYSTIEPLTPQAKAVIDASMEYE